MRHVISILIENEAGALRGRPRLPPEYSCLAGRSGNAAAGKTLKSAMPGKAVERKRIANSRPLRV